MNDAAERKLVLSHLWVAFIAFVVACFMGEYQVLERSGFIPALDSPSVYFASVSTHGVLMAFVLTTFFIMGFGYIIATTSLKQPVWNKPLAWGGFWLALVGVVLAAIPLLTGKASVLYTFYPPIVAHLVRHHAGDVCPMEKSQRRATRAFSDVCNDNECNAMAMDKRRCSLGSAFSIDSFFLRLDRYD
jgi:heme/copper-type cytochrome/quinol oxidase subunit 1